MDDDEETKSHASNESDSKLQQENSNQSPPSPPSSGIVTVTVASAAPPPPSLVMSGIPTPAPPSLTLALPIQNTPSRPALIPAPTPIQTVILGSGGGGSGGGGGRDDVWSDKATSILIDAWGERYMELSRGNLKQKHWQEVADIVNNSGEYGKTFKTDIQCKNRIDTVKKKFKVEKAKVVGGCGHSQWQFYERLDRLIAPSGSNSVSKVSVSPAQEASVPVGIPLGGRQPMSLPFVNYNASLNLQALPLQQHQPQPIRHSFPSPISQQQRVNYHSMSMNNNMGNNVNHNYSSPVSNVSVGNSSGRQFQMLQQQRQQQHQLQYQQLQQQQMRRGAVTPPVPTPVVELESEEEGWSGESGDSLPPETGYKRKRGGDGVNVRGGVKKGKGKKAVKVWGNSVRELTRAILKFGEAYETAESAKLEHIVEMEKQRMKFAKELELQRMKFLMKTQLELSQFNGGGGGSGSGSGSGNSDSRGGTSSGRRGGGGDGGSGGGGVESNHVH